MSAPSRETIEQINLERLASWGQKLAANNATPILLLGVGHGDRSGQLNVCVCKAVCEGLDLGDFAMEDVKAAVRFLYHAIVLEGRTF